MSVGDLVKISDLCAELAISRPAVDRMVSDGLLHPTTVRIGYGGAMTITSEEADFVRKAASIHDRTGVAMLNVMRVLAHESVLLAA